MQTSSVNVFTLCAPCACRCRHCLLSYDGRTIGADYARSAAYASRFQVWLRENRPEISFQFFIGCAMELPIFFEYVDFCRENGFASGEFLQLNGLRMRNSVEIHEYLRNAQKHGVRLIDLTFYGTREYHDRFAARKGDFDYLLRILQTANEIGLDAEISVALSCENAAQMPALLDALSAYKVAHLYFFVPHSEGRGDTLENIRLTDSAFRNLDPRVRLNRERFRTAREWAQIGFPMPQKRMLGLSLTKDAIEILERESFVDTLSRLEQDDDDYYALFPAPEILLTESREEFGDKLYSERDLSLRLRREYKRLRGISADFDDERFDFSRRF